MKKIIPLFALTLLFSFWNKQVFAGDYVFPKDTSYTTQATFVKLHKHYPYIQIMPLLKNDNRLKSYMDEVYKTIPHGKDLRRLHLDVYRPNNKKKYPALVMVHGGGWSSGNKSMGGPLAQRIALDGYVVIPIEYELSLEAPYPNAVYDIKSAIRFIKDNAEKYGIDTSKVAIEGESAGGHLAMLTAMTNGVAHFEGDKGTSKSSSTVQAGIDVDGVVNFLAPTSLNLKRKPNSADIRWLQGSFAEKPLIWKEASPIYWVNEHSVPVAFITSTRARFHSGRDEMRDMYSEYDIYSEAHTIPDSPHSFWMYTPWFYPTKSYIVGFLDKVFKGK